ncbi:hypothetical protein L3Y34_019933 [Caenorhabditis briggsae]|uniref:Uncharacterized protein n=1 Tax=Caenorhabditis briggsae TaxID=6238 RepID=A0AAE9DPF5_CAEBR|nr:hypothetical protein L3Y34_019933 [Caenorhabditis briggsae]
MGNTEEELVEEWVQDSQNGSQVPLDHLVSLYGYALLGLEDSDETVRFRKIEPSHEVEYVSDMTGETEQHYSEETDQKVKEREYEEPKRRVRTEMDRTMDRRDRDDNHSNYYIAEG